MKRYSIFLLAIIGLLSFPSNASANAGTPLMWAGALHLTIGNFFIGILEGLLLGWIFRVPKTRAVRVMIGANYLSAWLGWAVIDGAIVRSLEMDLGNAWSWYWIMV